MGLGHGLEAGSEQPARRKEGTAACSWCRGQSAEEVGGVRLGVRPPEPGSPS